MALDLDAARDDPTVYVGESFVIREGDVVLPPLSCEVYSHFPACPRFVEELVVDELTRCVFCVESLAANNRPLSWTGQLFQSLGRYKNKTHHWKEQSKISKRTNCQSHTPKYREAPSF